MTDKKTAAALKENAEGLRAKGFKPNVSDLRYIKLAEYENRDEELFLRNFTLCKYSYYFRAFIYNAAKEEKRTINIKIFNAECMSEKRIYFEALKIALENVTNDEYLMSLEYTGRDNWR